MRKHGGVAFGPDAGELLRARGLRVTPQRRAILGAFSHGAAEHLSADEIHARAAAVVPELGRGTVYAALAELTELGLLAARGSPEPVRYETNTEPHQHFRCRLCLRLFDVALADPALGARGLRRRADHDHRGGRLRRVRRLRQGPARGCEAGARRPAPDFPEGLAATTADDAGRPADARRDRRRGDARRLRRPRRRPRAPRRDRRPPRQPRRPRPPRRREGGGRGVLRRPARPRSARSTGTGCRGRRPCAPRWPSRAPSSRPTTPSTRPRSARERGLVLGANPLAILIPCHRVTRGREMPDEYVGGAERRLALCELERS